MIGIFSRAGTHAIDARLHRGQDRTLTMSAIPLRLLLIAGCSASCAMPGCSSTSSSALPLEQRWEGRQRIDAHRPHGMPVHTPLTLRGGGGGSILDMNGAEQEERGVIPNERRMSMRVGEQGLRTGNPVPGPEDQVFLSR